MSLAEASQERKKRLLALRRRKEGKGDENGAGELPVTHRNFDPSTRTLKKHNASDAMDEDTVEKRVEGLAQKVIAEHEEIRAQELDLINIAPKRMNWDLKRETQKKLAKLERQTQEAIHTLIRQRLAAQKGADGDILGAMKAQEAADKANDSDED